MSTMSLRKNRARNKKTKRTKSERKRKKQKRENQKKIKELEKDNSHFFFFFFACLRPISCSRIFFYKMRVLKRDRIYKIKRETNLREKKIEKIEKLQQISTSYLHTKKKKEIKQCLMYCAPDFTVAQRTRNSHLGICKYHLRGWGGSQQIIIRHQLHLIDNIFNQLAIYPWLAIYLSFVDSTKDCV